jgi:cytochrome c-type biogenesis protein CcmF
MSPHAPYQVPHSPLATLGTATLIAAFLVNAYALVVSIAGQRRGKPALVRAGVFASWASSALMCLVSAVIVYAFLSHDYTIRYIAHYSDSSMPFFYKITAYWGGLDGSLMFWVWVLSMFSAVAIFVNRHRHHDIIGYVVATIAAVNVFFLYLLLFNKNPFTTFLTDPPLEGEGLNPLLQNYWMVIHPPSLYTGFVGMTIPFAFCIAALASGRLDDAWLHSIRSWVMIAWFFLSLGLILGGIWAYEELGWGGYWAWDPVENAGFLPWLTGTAFLHSTMIQERKGMLKIWNVVLMVTTFFLTIFGTFMTRSGAVQSVHAFGEDNQLALLFILFMAAVLIVSFGLVLYRLPALRSAATFESFISREFAFLLNNWILLTAAFFVLFATMFPTLSESIMGERITVGPPFFNKWMIPIGLLLLFLAAVGPLLAWRVTTRKKLLDQFAFSGTLMVVGTATIAIIWPRSMATQAFMSDRIHLPMALITFGLVFLSLGTVAQEMWRGTAVRRKQTGSDWFTSLVGIIVTKKRKYGGYFVHVGIALMFFGWAGKAFSVEKDVTLEQGGVTSLRGYDFKFIDLMEDDNANRTAVVAQLEVSRGGKQLLTVYPGQNHYHAGKQETTTEVAISRHLDQDFYAVLNGYDPQAKVANFKLFLNPLVNWIWLGFGFLAFGTAICLLPEWATSLIRPGRSRLGRAGELAIFFLILGGVTFGMVRLARAQDPAGAAQTQGKHVVAEGGNSDENDATVPPIARKLWSDIVCQCGDCKRLTLAACTCTQARDERQRILAMLKDGKYDLSTPAGEKAAYDSIIDAYVKRFGGEQILTVPRDKGFNKLAWAVPYAVFFAALALIIVVAGRWVKRGREAAAAPPKLATAGAAPTAEETEDLDEKLDDELRDLD